MVDLIDTEQERNRKGGGRGGRDVGKIRRVKIRWMSENDGVQKQLADGKRSSG